MRMLAHFILLAVFFDAGQGLTQSMSQEELPDDYLPFTLHQYDDKLEGACVFLEGFKLSINVPSEIFESGVNPEALFSLIRSQNVTGILTYPNGKTTQIEYEIVHHRDAGEIYMKTSLGYFLWEYLSIQNGEISFAIYWWYCPPPTEKDLEIIKLAQELLADSSHWHKEDDRECEDDIENNQWSLFCSLKFSSMEISGEYNHHNTAMQTVRFVIDEYVPNHGFAHTLMDFNNAQSTRHSDILHVLELSRQRIERELLNYQNRDSGKDIDSGTDGAPAK